MKLTWDFFQAIAEPANRRNSDRPLLNLFAQAVDVDLNRVVADFFAPLAQSFNQLVFADQSACALQQHLQQAELAGGQIDHGAVNGGDAAALVVHQRAVFDGAARCARAAPHQGAHPGFELLQ